jgi:cyclopropane fatty-acyl-phospholipid synthase-like methyltransferase
MAQHRSQPLHQHFDDAERWAKVFDDPARDAWQKPAEVIRALALAPNATVADIGAGTGYFSVRLARAVPQGRVYAVDVAPSMVEHLKSRADQEKLANMVAQLADVADPRLPRPVDLVILVDTYHHIEDREDGRAAFPWDAVAWQAKFANVAGNPGDRVWRRRPEAMTTLGRP